jgi:hypothetical protein
LIQLLAQVAATAVFRGVHRPEVVALAAAVERKI